MNAELTFQKALLVLDKKGEIERGKDLLKESIENAKKEDDVLTQVSAKIVLSEILHMSGEIDECENMIKEINLIEIPDYLDDALDYEFSVLKDLKEKIGE